MTETTTPTRKRGPNHDLALGKALRLARGLPTAFLIAIVKGDVDEARAMAEREVDVQRTSLKLAQDDLRRVVRAANAVSALPSDHFSVFAAAVDPLLPSTVPESPAGEAS